MKLKILFVFEFYILATVSLKLKVEIKNSGKANYIEKDLIEFIEDGKNSILNNKAFNVKTKAVMVLGLTGTGKSTLVFYLNNVPLVSKEQGIKYVIEIQRNISDLPDFENIRIGHGSQSETKFPAVYSPAKKDFSYIDNPGFSDTRGIEVEIANGYFRQQITTKIKEIKFLLLVDYHDLVDKAAKFVDSVKGFSNFLGVFDNPDFKMVDKSIGIVVSKVSSIKNDKQVLLELKNITISVLNDEKRDLTKNQVEIFKKIISRDQIRLFSDPRRETVLNSDQSNKILAMLDNLDYIKTKDANIRVKIWDTYTTKLKHYIRSKFKELHDSLASTLDKNLKTVIEGKVLNNIASKNRDFYKISITHAKLKIYKSYSDAIGRVDGNHFDYFLSTIEEDVLNRKFKEKFSTKNSIIRFLIDILPDNNSIVFDYGKQSILNELNKKTEDLSKNMVRNSEMQYKWFKEALEEELKVQLIRYYQDTLADAAKIQDVHSIEIYLNGLLNLKKPKKLEDFLGKLGDKILNTTFKEKLLKEKSTIVAFLEVLPSEYQKPFIGPKNWLSSEFVSILKDMIAEIKQYKSENFDVLSDSGHYTYHSHFSSLSSILKDLESRTNKTNVQSLRVFASHLITIDTNVSFYFKDFIIIAPRIDVTENVVIDLSCKYRIPTVRLPKAMDGKMEGENGVNGKPGDPGCNGGSLILMSDNILNSARLHFISSGGQGGTGQDGGNGAEGTKGLDGVSLYKTIEKEPYFSFPFSLIKKPERKYYRGGKGGKGGDAGLGGIGGKGGLGGTFRKVELAKKSGIYIKVGENGKNGYNGKPGSAGIGGLIGRLRIDSIQKECMKTVCFFYHISPKFCYCASKDGNMSLTSAYNQDSDERAENGTASKRLNDNGLNPPSRTQISLYRIGTDFLNFLIDANRFKFKKSGILKSQFCKNIIAESIFIPDVFTLVERVRILNEDAHHHLFSQLEIKIIDLHVKSMNIDDKKLLMYAYAALKSTIYRHESAKKTALIVDVEEYLRLTCDYIKTWKSLVLENVRNAYKEDYENNLNKKIDEAKEFVTVLNEDIEASQMEVNRKIVSVLKEIREFKSESDKNSDILLKKQESLKNALAIKSFLTIFEIGAQALSFLGPKGALIGTLAQHGLSIANRFFDVEDVNIDLPANPELDKMIENYETRVKITELKNLQYEVKKLEVKKNFTRMTPTSLDSTKNHSGNSEFLELILKNNSYVDLSSKQPGGKKLTVTKKKLKAVKTSDNSRLDIKSIDEEVLSIVTDLYNEYKASKEDIDQIDDQLKANYKKYSFLGDLSESVNNFQKTVINEANNEINMIKGNLWQNSPAVLDFKKWKVKELLGNLKDQLKILVNAFESQTELLNTLNKLENSIITLIDIFDKIEAFIQQNELVNYIAAATKSNFNVGISPEYQKHAESLHKTILGNIIRERYQQAIVAFSYWTFPFICEYAKEIVYYESDNIDELTNNYAETLSNLLIRFSSSKTELKPSIDNHVQRFSFDTIPFFEWSLENYPIQIRNLFNGDKVMLFADIADALYDVIKFSKVYIKINNNNLTRLLENFKVELTHSGSSYFRFKKSNYLINLNYNKEKIMLRYRFGQENLDNSNESSQKIAKGYLLSPYTFWEMRFVPINPTNSKFIQQEINSIISENSDIKVSLHGQGQYVTDAYQKKTCSSKAVSRITSENNFECYSSIKIN